MQVWNKNIEPPAQFRKICDEYFKQWDDKKDDDKKIIPDLAIVDLKIEGSHFYNEDGEESISINTFVESLQGTVSIDDFNVTVYIDGVAWGVKTFPPVPSYQNDGWEVFSVIFLEPGTYEITAVIFPYIEEEDKSNNKVSESFEVLPIEPMLCNDTDGGLYPDIPGEAFNQFELGGMWSGHGAPDSCDFLDAHILREAYCDEIGMPRLKDFTCSGGKPYCYEGACSAKFPYCDDTDNGDNPYEAGTVTTFLDFLAPPPYTDYCQNTQTHQPWQLPYTDEPCEGPDCGLREVFCNDDKRTLGFTDHDCPQGCRDGACLDIDKNKPDLES